MCEAARQRKQARRETQIARVREMLAELQNEDGTYRLPTRGMKGRKLTLQSAGAGIADDLLVSTNSKIRSDLKYARHANPPHTRQTYEDKSGQYCLKRGRSTLSGHFLFMLLPCMWGLEFQKIPNKRRRGDKDGNKEELSRQRDHMEEL